MLSHCLTVLLTNKTFEGIFLALVGKLLQKKLRIIPVFETILYKKTFNFNFFVCYDNQPGNHFACSLCEFGFVRRLIALNIPSEQPIREQKTLSIEY